MAIGYCSRHGESSSRIREAAKYQIAVVGPSREIDLQDVSRCIVYVLTFTHLPEASLVISSVLETNVYSHGDLIVTS